MLGTGTVENSLTSSVFSFTEWKNTSVAVFSMYEAVCRETVLMIAISALSFQSLDD